MRPYFSIGPGQVYLDYGPMQLIILAERSGTFDTALAEEGAEEALALFSDLCAAAPRLRQRAQSLSAEDFAGAGPVALHMIRAAQATGDPQATPMLAVAGAMAQEVCGRLSRRGASRVIVNNGGDIALYLAPGESARVGAAANRSRPAAFQRLVHSGDGIGGVATSGLGGRSLTLGIASAAVAFSPDAALADACATLLGNAANTEDAAIERRRAEEVDPRTDIPGLYVTTAVGPLSDSAVRKALRNARRYAQRLAQRGLLRAAAVTVQGRTLFFPDASFFEIGND